MAPFSAFFGGFEFRAKCLDRRSKIAIYVAGPVVTTVVTAALFLVNSYTKIENQALSAALQNVMYGGAVQFFVTMIPITYLDWMGSYACAQSDGKRILNLWQENQHR